LGGMQPLRPITGARSMADEPVPLDERSDDEILKAFAKRVGDTRAAAALTIYRKRTGSTTLPELLAEDWLMRQGVRYRAQVVLLRARPDFVVFDQGPGVIVIRVQGDYWHASPGAVSKDSTQAEWLRSTTIDGFPVIKVADVWERDIYAGDFALSAALAL
jgi:G:T-mismatch repair DNA endonuclease (very short patch repair protein)